MKCTMSAKKKYGLLIPSKSSHRPLVRDVAVASVFADNSSEDEQEDENAARSRVSTSLWKEGVRKQEAKATHNMLSQALEQDPTVFAYDSVYDTLQEEKEHACQKSLRSRDTKPRYIAMLKKASEERKIEQDLVFERKVQKEREEEGDDFEDNEAFVTSAYRKKLEERAKMEDKLRKEARLEEANDVTKQNDLSRFYHHLLHQEIRVSDKSSQLSLEMDVQESGEVQKPDGRSEHLEESVHDNEPDLLLSLLNQSDDSHADQGTQDSEAVGAEELHGSVHREQVASDVHSSPRPSPNEEILEERRKKFFAKRTTDDARLSAKERYLARKKQKLSQPVIATDD